MEILSSVSDGSTNDFDTQEFQHVAIQNVPKQEEKRFEDISEDTLDTLALERNSYRTRKQTMWGVKIFKGETPFPILSTYTQIWLMGSH